MTDTDLLPHVSHSVRRVDRGDRDTVATVLAASFFDDPVTRWMYPDDAVRRAALPRLFTFYFDLFAPHDETFVNGDASGVALWLAPGDDLLDAEQAEEFPRAAAEAAGPGADQFMVLVDILDAHVPTDPHWQLQLLGTLPDRQGQGIGSAFLRDRLREADAAGQAAYLEATSLRSRALYERHGFECRGEIVLPDGPTLWPMWRDPR